MNEPADQHDVDPLGRGLLGRSVVEHRSTEGEVPPPAPVVVKTLEHVTVPDPDQFRRHFESLTRLDHPHLVEYGSLRSTEYPIAFEQDYFEGIDIISYLRRPPTPEELQTLRRRFSDEPPAEADDEASEAEEASGGEPADTTGDDSETPTAAPATEGDSTNQAWPAETPGQPADPADEDGGAQHEVEREFSSGPYEKADASSAVARPSQDFPEVHTYGEAGLGDEESSDVVLDPPDDERTEVELLDVVFLRLEHLMSQVLGALEYLHRFKRPHGGLKPSNILVDAHGRCALADFGLLAELTVTPPDDAEPDEPIPPPDDELTYARAYTAPEVREGLEPTLESDLYALGCVLFEAITGCRPVDLEDDEADDTVATDTRYDLRPSALSEIEPRCPAAWVDLIFRLLDPDPDERPDFDEIRAVLSSSRGRSVDIPPSFVPEKQSFFGRDDVFDRLVANAEQCVSGGAARVSILSGSAGYGKTAMAERLAQWAAQRGWIALRGHCYDRSSIIYQGWDAIAWQLAAICKHAMGGLDEKTDRLRRRAGRLFPVLTPDDPSEHEDLERLEAVAALRELLRVVSHERPTMLLLDDLNWSSPDTADLLSDVVAEPEGMQCHVVGTWRLDDASDNERLVEGLDSAPVDVDWVRVRGFRPDEADEYVDAIADLAPGLRERVLEVGGENPLLIEELIYQLHLDQMAHDERIARETAGAEGPSNETPVGVPTPETGILEDPPERIEDRLVRIVERRIEALSRRELFIIQILSVATIPLPEQMLSLMLDEEFHSGESMSQSLRLLLDRLRSLRLVRQVETDRWERAYTLFHNLSRSLVVDDIHEQHHTHLCEHLAAALRRVWPEADELRFEYLIRADNTSDALDLAQRAARTAESRFAYDRAASLWTWIADKSDRAERRTTMRPTEELARVARLAGQPRRAAGLYHELADGLPTGVARSKHRLREFEASLEAGRRRQALASLEDALSAFGERYFRTGLFDKLREWKDRAVAATNRWSDDIDELEHDPLGGRDSLKLKLYRHILFKNDILDSTRGAPFRVKFSATAERAKDALLLGYDRLFLARTCQHYRMHTRANRAREWYDETERLFERTDDHWGLAHMAIGRSRLARNDGAFSEADEWLDRAASELGQSDEIRDRESYLLAYERALLHRDRGQLDRAVRRARKLRHFYRGNRMAAFRANQVLIPTHLLHGNLDRVELLLDECIAFLKDGPPTTAGVWLARQQSRLNLALGRPEVARGQLDMLDDRAQSTGLLKDPYVELTYYLSRGQALSALAERKREIGEGRRDEIDGDLADIVDTLRAFDHTVVPPLEAEIERFFARNALYRNRPDDAVDHLETALDHLADYPDPVSRALCGEALGRTLRRRDEADGLTLLENSRAIFEDIGCTDPLVLEGWPIPEHLTTLRRDDEENDGA